MPKSLGKTNMSMKDAIRFNTHQGKLQLTSSDLEKWFATLEIASPIIRSSNTTNNTQLSLEYLGRYGIKSSLDVILFLNSPAGHEILGLIEKKIDEILLKEELNYTALLEANASRELAALLLGLLYQDKEERRMHHAMIEEDMRLVSKKKTQPNTVELELALQRKKALYAESIHALDRALENNHKERKTIETELEEIEKQETSLKKRYQFIEGSLAVLDNLDLLFSSNSPRHTLDSLQEQIKQLNAQINTPDPEKEIKSLQIQLDSLKQQQDFLQRNIDLSPQLLLKKQIEELREHSEKKSFEISKLFEKNQPEKATSFLHELHALHFQISGIKDILSVMKGQKILYGNEGQEVHSFAQARFVVPKTESLVFKEGKFYLLRPEQSPHQFDSFSQEDKTRAHQNYVYNQSNILNLKLLIVNHREIEQVKLSERKSNLVERKDYLEKSSSQIQEKIEQLNSSTRTINDSLSSLPKPTPVPVKKDTKDENFSSYGYMLRLIKLNPTLSTVRTIKAMEKLRKPSGQISKKLNDALTQIEEQIKKGIKRPDMANLEQYLREKANKIASSNKHATTPTPYSTSPKIKPYS